MQITVIADNERKQVDVPLYLQDGYLFDELVASEEENAGTLDSSLDKSLFVAPANCTKMTDSVKSFGDALHLLQSVRFWCVRAIPFPLFAYALDAVRKKECPKLTVDLEHAFERFLHFSTDVRFFMALVSTDWTNIDDDDTEFPIFLALRLNVSSSLVHNLLTWTQKGSGIMMTVSDRLVDYAVDCGNLFFLSHVVISECGNAVKLSRCTIAAQQSDIHTLRFLVNNCQYRPMYDVNNDTFRYSVVCTAAAASGSVECLLFLLENGFITTPDTINKAVEHNRFHCLKLLLERPLQLVAHSTAQLAVEHGALECLRLLVDEGLVRPPFTLTETAAKNRHMECLNLMIEKRLLIIPFNCVHRDLVECLRFQVEVNGYLCTDEDACSAARQGSLQCVQYLFQIGVIRQDSIEVCRAAASQNRLNVIQFLLDQGVVCDSSVTVSAAASGHIDSIKLLQLHNQLHVTVEAKQRALEHNFYDCFRFLCEMEPKHISFSTVY